MSEAKTPAELREIQREQIGFFPHSHLDLHSEAEIHQIEPMVDLDIGLAADSAGGRHGLWVVPFPYAVSNGVPLPRRAIPNGTHGAEASTWTVIHNVRTPAEGAETLHLPLIRLARCRYLCYKGDLHRLFPSLDYVQKQAVAAHYFGGVVPMAQGPQHAAMWGTLRERR